LPPIRFILAPAESFFGESDVSTMARKCRLAALVMLEIPRYDDREQGASLHLIPSRSARMPSLEQQLARRGRLGMWMLLVAVAAVLVAPEEAKGGQAC
jgi:hypothetical protein